ncbi:dipeptide ABC transporter ATP-binding protein [Rhodoligotrophos defluvii]|uniref:dipeptide ABC transporter ATP-binding protein n=1 Tax=Rhodoligotrophos defluvii TaxID=2561934 RepID=UPI0010C95589|nr:ABC transporter ATP-binding protein [Rhodoligotrophos defluvii]
MSKACIEVTGLTLDYRTPVGWQRAVNDVSFDVRRGEVLGLVGESGSGKSTVAYQLLGYRPPNARLRSGRVLFEGTDIASLPLAELQKLRGNRISFVPQNPTTALNPAMTVGDQIAEVLRAHKRLDRQGIDARFVQLMAQVGLGAIGDIARRFPHRLSGGQQQRVAIAMALACEPELVVLDEPTTGLDVTVQQQIVELLRSLRSSRGVSMLYVTHDLPLLRQIADRVGVMYRGELVEIGQTEQIFTRPRNPYARTLIKAVPLFQPAPVRPVELGQTQQPLLAADKLCIGYGGRRGLFGIGQAQGTTVVHDVSLSIGMDETFALIGESGSGKSTIARALCGLVAPLSGTILYREKPLAPTIGERTADQRREIQYIFQNPDASLNPRMRVGEILARPLDVFFGERGRQVRAKLEKALEDVRLDPAYLSRFPHELSGGERQRVAIARALIARPSLLLCDEVLSALDVSVQARVLELLKELRARTGVSMLFISHDLGVVRSLADHVGVLYQGRLVEVGPTEKIYTSPEHPYTRRLLAAAVGTLGASAGAAAVRLNEAM